jgi:lysozyme
MSSWKLNGEILTFDLKGAALADNNDISNSSTKNNKRTILLLLIIAQLLFTAYIFFDRGFIRFNYPSRANYPIQGIDISHYQGSIDWNKFKSESIDFIIIKATEGADYQDHMFQANYDSAKVYGYTIGAYHFYRFCTDVNLQAQNFLKSIGTKDLRIPPCVDLELGGNCKTDKSDKEVRDEIHVFLNIIQQKTGKMPVLYATEEFYNRYMRGEFAEYPIWIRNIYAKPQLPDSKSWTIWQYANKGRLSGIEKAVDLNVFRGSKIEFYK